MSTDGNAGPMVYASPRLRILGSVHDLTRGGLGTSSDGLLFKGTVGGIVISSS